MRYLTMCGASALLLLAACEGVTPQQAATLTLAEACEAYAGALRVVTPQIQAGLVDAEDIATIDQANVATDAVCVGPPPADPVAAVTRVTSAVTTVMLIQAQED